MTVHNDHRRFLRVRPRVLIISLCLSVSMAIFGAQMSFAEEHYLELVPAETSYLAYFEMSELTLNPAQSAAMKGMTISAEADVLKNPNAGERMVGLLTREFLIALQAGDLTPLGLKGLSELKVGLHGLGLWPVASFNLSDQSRFTHLIAQKAKSAGIIPKLNGSALVFDLGSELKVPLDLVVSFPSAHWVNLSLVPRPYLEEMLPSLTGKTKPKVSMRRAKMFESWAKEAKISSKNAFFLSFERIIRTLLGRGQGVNKRFAWIDDHFLNTIPPSCVTEYLEIASAAPYIILGPHLSPQDAQHSGRLVWHFSGPLAQATQKIMGSQSYLSDPQGSLFSLSLSLNIKGLLDAIQSYLQTRIERPYTCPHLSEMSKPEKLQMLLSQLMMIPPFLFDINGLSLAIDEIQPQVQARLNISATHIANLLNLLKSLQPQFAELPLPAVDGEPIILQGLPLPPSITVMAQMKANVLGLSTGQEQAQKVGVALSLPPEVKPALFDSQINVSKMITLFEQYMNATQRAMQSANQAQYEIEVEQAKKDGLPPPPPPPAAKNPLDSMDIVNEIKLESLRSSIKLTAHGLEWGFSIKVKE